MLPRRLPTAPPVRAGGPVESRGAAVAVAGFLLLLQAVVVLAVVFYAVRQTPGLAPVMLMDVASLAAMGVTLQRAAGGLPPVALLALAAAIPFFSRRRAGWTLAMLTQAALLVVTLATYLSGEPYPVYLFPLMFYGLVMTLYLNSYDVRIAFRTQSAVGELELERE